MKKLISIILVISFVATFTVAFAADYSSMTDEQLKEQLDATRNELAKRGFVAKKKTVILEQAGIQIYINGDIYIDKDYSWSDDYYLYIPVVVINDTTSNISIMVENPSMNGWTTQGADSGTSTPAGKKAKGSLYFSLEDADVETLEDFTDVEFTLTIYDSSTYKNIVKTGPITIYSPN